MNIRIAGFQLKLVVVPELQATCSADAITELVTVAADTLNLHPSVGDAIKHEILAHEKDRLFALGQGFAVPYVKHAALTRIAIVFGHSGAGIPYSALDGRPIRSFLLLLSPLPSPPEYHVFFGRLLTMLGNRRVRSCFQFVKTREQILDAFVEAERELHAAPFTI